MKLNLIDVINDPEVDMVLDPYAFEDYCGSCDKFPYNTKNDERDIQQCPFKESVNEYTRWSRLGCTKYMN